MPKIFTVCLLIFIIACNQKTNEKPKNNILESLSDNFETKFKKVTEPKVFNFPEDHGEHQDYQTEWWYYTGNLNTKNNLNFGYQLTFFRRAVSTEKKTSTSKWNTNQIYFAHFTLTDEKNNKFYNFEKFNRGSIDIAGVKSDPYNVWIENWEVKEKNNDIYLKAESEGININLKLSKIKPIVLHGNKGFSQKNSGIGNASYYYSYPRMKTQGIISINENRFKTEGYSWFDHEWSTSVLTKDQTGWDWFSIQFEDNTELMIFVIRKKDGSIEDFSSGTFIDSNGKSEKLVKDDFAIKVKNYWKSPTTKIKYPSEWNITIAKKSINLNISTLINNQELKTKSFVYWEGSVKVTGSNKGKGYVEMTGY